MPDFRVHFNDGEVLKVIAETPTDAANHIRKRFPGAIVNKVKRDKSAKRITVKHHKSELVSQLVEAGQLAGYKIFNNRQSDTPDMIGSDGTAVTIVNGRSGTVIVDEYHFATGQSFKA